MRSKIYIAVVLMLFSIVNSYAQIKQLKKSQMNQETSFRQIFPQGEKLPQQFSQYFIGQAYLAPLTKNQALQVPVSNVTFEPGCRNNWHSHTGGQLLICIAGRGYYQEQGKPARELLPGSIVEIAPNVVHWHGAAPDSWFSHLAVECNPMTNQNTWLGEVNDAEYAEATTAKVKKNSNLSEAAKRNHDAWFPGYVSKARSTDPDLIEVFDNFAFDEVLKHGKLDTKTRIMVIMASTIAQHTVHEYNMMLRAALANGVTPVEIKEILYHAVPYAGIAKVVDFIGVTNDFMTLNGIALPVQSQAVTTPETRMEKGLLLQKEIFGDRIDRMYENSPKNQLHIQQYLSANCFGDYQTRTGLNTKMREMLTFAILVSMGGCESQVKGHIQGNVNVGNDKETLLDVVTQLLPYIGYPRTLNAIACLNEVLPENK